MNGLVVALVHALIRETLDQEHYADLLMQGRTPEHARRATEDRRADHDRIRAGELPPFNRERCD